MNREQEIEQFLYALKARLMEVPSSVTHGYIYSQLNQYGLNYPGKRVNYESLFDYWENRNVDNPNLAVYRHPKQPGFLQFQKHDHYDVNDPNIAKYIKLYISIEPEFMQKAVDIIFDYISRNNIENHSKVSARDRSDSIVLRIRQPEEAKQIMDFINNHEELQKHSRPTNPFISRSGVVGTTFDDRISYNYTVAFMIQNYLDEKKYLNALSEVNINDFKLYIKNYFRRTFITCEGLSKLRNTEEFQENLDRLRNEYPNEKDLEEALLINFMHVINVIGISLNDNTRFSKIEQAYQTTFDAEFTDQYKTKFKQVLSKDCDDKELLDEYIKYAYLKYNKNITHVTYYLSGYVRGHKNHITRDNNFRELFAERLEPQKVLEIANNNLREYVKSVTETMKYLGYSTFVESCKATYSRYGKKQLIYAIKCSLEGDYAKFTNQEQNKLREKLREYVEPKDIPGYLSTILESNGLDYDEEAILNVADIIEELELQKENNVAKKNR